MFKEITTDYTENPQRPQMGDLNSALANGMGTAQKMNKPLNARELHEQIQKSRANYSTQASTASNASSRVEMTGEFIRLADFQMADRVDAEDLNAKLAQWESYKDSLDAFLAEQREFLQRHRQQEEANLPEVERVLNEDREVHIRSRVASIKIQAEIEKTQ